MFVPYLIWSLELLVRLPPFCFISLGVAGNLVASIVIQKPFSREIWRGRYRIAVLQFVCYLATLLVAAFGEVSGPEPNEWGFRANYALALISIGLGIYWIWLIKDWRWFAISLAVLQLWLLYGANLIAGMALTGRWL